MNTLSQDEDASLIFHFKYEHFRTAMIQPIAGRIGIAPPDTHVISIQNPEIYYRFAEVYFLAISDDLDFRFFDTMEAAKHARMLRNL